MGLVYTIQMQDDFNWKYVDKDKSYYTKKFIEEFYKECNVKPELLAEWYGHLVFDLDKYSPLLDGAKQTILNNCDSCVYWNDNQPYNKLNLK